ncbi:alpha/beta hydrolase [Bacillus sp. JCM 19041]|uniref:intracellular short-chain-length polyhydroxyalkanoate depolymerase n=1 Tax=Bacillus sp. JCM 19041 TaxID=1460637 RepID=UPI000A433E43
MLLHGNLASSDQWDLLMEHIPSDYTIYAPDLRGYGKSTYNNPITSFNDFARDIKLFCDELKLKSVHLIGWSNGGGVAMQFAANYPTQVKKLILLASISTRGFPAFNAEGDRMKRVEEFTSDPMINRMLDAQVKGERSFFGEAMNQLVYPRNKPEKVRFEKYIEGAMNQRNLIDVADAANRFNISAVSNGVSKGNRDIKKIIAPILVLSGKHDLMVPETMNLELINDMKAHHIHFDYKVLNTGHSPLVDDINGVIKEISQFLM